MEQITVFFRSITNHLFIPFMLHNISNNKSRGDTEVQFSNFITAYSCYVHLDN